ncbi:arsenate reductase (glutaredoxin) [Roseomonas chloroacetimidivorans]|uniref:arsenate reductase (glutaredoxin) n=1 Tax=Roseomonas chloroacetimidivorans TaxID=1766656 RepID=UPI003C7409CB
MTVTIYHDPDCETSRDVLALIRNSGEEPRIVGYLETPPARQELTELVRRMGFPVRQLLRREEALYDELGLDDAGLTDIELIDLMAKHPTLIRGPIVVSPLGVRLCVPAQAVLSMLPEAQHGAFSKENGERVLDDQGRRVAPGRSG